MKVKEEFRTKVSHVQWKKKFSLSGQRKHLKFWVGVLHPRARQTLTKEDILRVWRCNGNLLCENNESNWESESLLLKLITRVVNGWDLIRDEVLISALQLSFGSLLTHLMTSRLLCFPLRSRSSPRLFFLKFRRCTEIWYFWRQKPRQTTTSNPVWIH